MTTHNIMIKDNVQLFDLIGKTYKCVNDFQHSECIPYSA